MDCDIETLVERAIVHTLTWLRAAACDRRVARAGLERILADLAARAPGHPALARLDDFIAEFRRPLDEEGASKPTGRTDPSGSLWPKCGNAG